MRVRTPICVATLFSMMFWWALQAGAAETVASPTAVDRAADRVQVADSGPAPATPPQNPGSAFFATARRAMVASVHPLATEAGVEAIRRGGNAIDAAVAAALTLGVVDGHNSGIGGGCFMLIRKADGTILAIDGREMAPAAATHDMFIRDGKVIPNASTTGALASGIPGSLMAYDYALRHGGTRTLAELLNPAASLAEKGFAINASYASRLKATARDLAKFPVSAAIFLREGQPRSAGETLRQPDLAHTYRAIAENGIGWFYGGPFAVAAEKWMSANGGILTSNDFSNYRIVLREPIQSTYRGYAIVGFPPPSSGGAHVAQILNILESFDLKSLEPATRLHVQAEAMKLAFADRAYWLGDPDFVKVPRGLVARDYAKSLAGKIDLHRASDIAGHGTPDRSEIDLFLQTLPPAGKHTTHIAAADGEGNWVALTTTVNTSFGSKVVVPGTGVLLNDQMDDFSVQPGTPNAFGLIGAEANSVGPGKRPLSSMSPTIVLKDGQPLFTLGAAGGPTIISQVVDTIVNRIDLSMPLEQAVAAPRIHHQWRPDVLVVERTSSSGKASDIESGKRFDAATELTKFGHRVEIRSALGATQAIARLPDGTFVGVHDPRVEGSAAGAD